MTLPEPGPNPHVIAENAWFVAADPYEIVVFRLDVGFIKALGDGLYHPLNRFDVSLTPGEPASILRVENTPGADYGWRMDANEASMIAPISASSRRGTLSNSQRVLVYRSTC